MASAGAPYYGSTPSSVSGSSEWLSMGVANWSFVTSGVPQGTVPAPILFNLFINDIVDVVSPGSEIRLFVADYICYRNVRSLQDCETLQQDIDRLAFWADTWLMDFAPTKCRPCASLRRRVIISRTRAILRLWPLTLSKK